MISERHTWYFLFNALDLGLHEAGHFLFLPLVWFSDGAEWAKFMNVFGGSLTQWAVPALCMSYFLWSKQWFAAAVVLFWLGQSFHSSVLYIGDARDMVLPLLGGEGSGHDWNYLLHQMGVLYKEKEVAAVVEKFSHILVMISAVSAWGFWLFGLFPKHRKKLSAST